MKLFFSIFFLLGINIIISSQNAFIYFTENNGQWDKQILFKSKLDGGSLFIEKSGLTFNFYDKIKFRALHHGGLLKDAVKDDEIKFHAYKIHFENSKAFPNVEKKNEISAYENYFIGSDESKWRSNVKSYNTVFLREIYKNIDYEITSLNNGLKYNFHVKPHADPSVIRLRYEGVEDIKLLQGALIIKLSINEVIEQKPYAYQIINGIKTQIACNYNLKSSVLSFEFPNGFDKNYELTIDPVLVFAAQSGSTVDNFGMTATYDTQGNLYSGGTAYGAGYPVTTGAYSTLFAANTNSVYTNDVVITKYNSTGTNLLYSTYFGGTENELIMSIVVDGNNNLCVYGITGSSNFPVKVGAYDQTFNSGSPVTFLSSGGIFTQGTDIFVGKFNSSGTALLGCTYLGGSNNDGLNHVNHLSVVAANTFEYLPDSLQFNYGDQYRGEIQVDPSNNIYITSSTRSSDFPTVNAYDNSLGGKQDAVLVKFNSSLTQLLYSTYLGGNKNDCGNSLVVMSQSEVYVTGGTCSQDFPATLGANNSVYNGGKTDGFITHFSALGNQIIHSTYVGTNNYDQSYFIQSDKNNDLFIFGQSLGNMSIINTGTIVPYNNQYTHQFITRFSKDLSTKKMSTVIGSKTNDVDLSPTAFGIDKCNHIYLTGWGRDPNVNNTLTNMPLASPTQSATDGSDFYLMVLDSNAASLTYGSYFGGNLSNEHVDGGTSRIDKNGTFYQSVCAGCAGHDDFPVTSGAWPNTPGNPNHSNNCNSAVFKISSQYSITSANINSNLNTGCAPLTVSFINNSSNFATYNWYLTGGTTNSTNLSPVVTFTSPGVYTISLVVKNPLSCNKLDSAITIINVISGSAPSLSVYPLNPVLCVGESITLNAVGASSYSWNTGSTSSSVAISPTITTVYYVIGTGTNGCQSTASFTQVVENCTQLTTQTLDAPDFTIYPIPVSDVLQISANNNIKSVTLFTTYGELLIESKQYNSKDVEVDVHILKPGLYIVELYFENASASIKKVLKIE